MILCTAYCVLRYNLLRGTQYVVFMNYKVPRTLRFSCTRVCLLDVFGLLTCIHQAVPKACVILECAGIACVIGIAGVNAGSPGCDDVIGIES